MLWLSHDVHDAHGLQAWNGGGQKGPPSAPPTIPPIIINPFSYRTPSAPIDPRVEPDPPPIVPPPTRPIRLAH